MSEISNANLSYLDFSHHFLGGYRFERVNFSKCDFIKTDFTNSYLLDCDFSNAYFEKADFTDCTLEYTDDVIGDIDLSFLSNCITKRTEVIAKDTRFIFDEWEG